ncbi:hypothetical protein, partial [Endozoicomonas sp. ISHI1]|uniref:hypothetical protein n=1 Tax=Endozoicomonas sp. ISHI1 TaxID=2825882 RepID=UPI0021491ADE
IGLKIPASSSNSSLFSSEAEIFILNFLQSSLRTLKSDRLLANIQPKFAGGSLPTPINGPEKTE